MDILAMLLAALCIYANFHHLCAGVRISHLTGLWI
jgi:hypothetical protein